MFHSFFYPPWKLGKWTRQSLKKFFPSKDIVIFKSVYVHVQNSDTHFLWKESITVLFIAADVFSITTTTKTTLLFLLDKKKLKHTVMNKRRIFPMNLSVADVKAALASVFTIFNGVLMWEYCFSKRKRVFYSLLDLRAQLILCFSCKLVNFLPCFTPKELPYLTNEEK